MKQSDFSFATMDKLRSMPDSDGNVIMLSSPGVGKTERVHQYTADRDIGLVTFNLASTSAPDIGGFMFPDKDDRGRRVSRYTLPFILEQVEATGKDEGIIFFDELLQAEHLEQKAIGPALDAQRRLGAYGIPQGWSVWAASNRAKDRAGVNRLLGHITNRFFVVNIEPDLQGWLKWAARQGIHPLYMTAAQSRPGLFFSGEAPKDPSQPYATPRSLVKAHNFHTLGVEGVELPSDPVTQEMVAGAVGDGVAAEMFAIFKVANELPAIEDILDKPDTAKLPSSDRLDAQYAAMQLGVHHADAQNVDPIFTYICRLNKELQTSAAAQILEKTGGALLNSKVMGKFIRENAALITSTLG